jgi:hypothetical protein
MYSKIAKKVLQILVTLLGLCLIFLPIAGLGLSVYSSPNINNPRYEHLHFRMMLKIDGERINFGDAKFQESFMAGQCSGSLTQTPIHFHDNSDQFVHIHWADITGGQVLKYYGLNYIGGNDMVLGYNISDLLSLKGGVKEIKIHGKVLPDPKNKDNLFVYTGYRAENGDIEFQKQEKSKFLRMNLESFFNKESEIKKQKREAEELKKNKTGLFNSINVLAHGGHDHFEEIKSNTTKNSVEFKNQESLPVLEINSDKTETEKTPNIDTPELKRLNNLLGNVSIFIQESEPNSSEIAESFSNLLPLSDSTCGG